MPASGSGMILLVRLLAACLGAASAASRGLVGLLLRIAPERCAPVIEWPRPDGPHAVGTRAAEISAPGAPRRLMARLWYPAATVRGCARRAYFGGAAELEAMAQGLDRLLSRALVRRLGLIQTWSHDDAPVAGAARMPVIVFSHAYTGYLEQNTHLCEHLASHGYLVISLAHPGGASIVRYPDGSELRLPEDANRRLVTPQYLLGMLRLRKAMPEQQRLQLLRQVALTPLAQEDRRWADDIGAAIDVLSGPRPGPDLAGLLARADWSRLGLVGMSLGGSASATAAQSDPRVRLAVNLDGMQQGAGLLNVESRVPMLMLHGEEALSADGVACTHHHYRSPAADGKAADVERWVVQGAGHFDFTDAAVFGRGPVRTMLRLGRVDGAQMLALVATVVRNFLDTRLLGAPPREFRHSALRKYP